MLRFGVRIGRVREEDQKAFAAVFWRAFRRRVEFEPLRTQPGFVAVIMPEVHGSVWAKRYHEAVMMFNAMRTQTVAAAV